MASRHVLIPWIAATGTSFSPLPCQAWHGYMVTNAHSVEVDVGADGLASALSSGAPTDATLTTDGPDGVGAIAMGEAGATFKDTRKTVLSLNSPLSLLYVTTPEKVTIHLTLDPINFRQLRIIRVPKPPLEEGEVSPPKPIFHTHE